VIHYAIGIDASYAAVGWAVVKSTGQPEVLMSGALGFRKDQRAEEKLPVIVSQVAELFRQILAVLPDEPVQPAMTPAAFTVAIEQSWHGKNARVASQLAELRGALIVVAFEFCSMVKRVTPGEWQSAAGIPRRAKRATVKKQSQHIATLREGRTAGMSEDEADAINIAWYAAGKIRMGRKA